MTIDNVCNMVHTKRGQCLLPYGHERTHFFRGDIEILEDRLKKAVASLERIDEQAQHGDSPAMQWIHATACGALRDATPPNRVSTGVEPLDSAGGNK